jgi:hypothetical protein
VAIMRGHAPCLRTQRKGAETVQGLAEHSEENVARLLAAGAAEALTAAVNANPAVAALLQAVVAFAREALLGIVG